MSEKLNPKKRRSESAGLSSSSQDGAAHASKKAKLESSSAPDAQKSGALSNVRKQKGGIKAHEISTPGAGPSKPRPHQNPDTAKTSIDKSKKTKEGHGQPLQITNSTGSKIRKLAPPRPFPTVPTSVSATGPRSAHKEGKNRICITRKTELGMYLRRCKDVILKDGYKTLHLHAMGAAIPHLARLAVSLPGILPFAASDIQTEVRTGSAELQDEIIPEDEGEDITLRTRGKSTMNVIIKIEGGDIESSEQDGQISKQKRKRKNKKQKSQNDGPHEEIANASQPEQIVFTEGDLEDDDMVT